MKITPVSRPIVTLSIISLFASAIAACSAVEDVSPLAEQPNPTPSPSVQPVAETPTPSQPSVVLATSDWEAWADFMPGIDTPSLHLQGQVQLPNPGYEVSLERVVQTEMTDTLVYDLKVTQKPGNWAQVVTTQTVKHEDSTYTGNDQNVQIRLPDGSIQKLPLERTY